MALINRQKYLDEALLFLDTDLIKVVTGIRRCGKSSLLGLVEKHLRDQGISQSRVVSLNLESKDNPVKSEDELYIYFKSRLSEEGRTYIFIDEVQKVTGWEEAVNAMRVDFDCDIFVTGSNAYLLSSELSTYLSGRYVEIKMLPLVFSEYLDFCSLSLASDENTGIAVDQEGTPYLVDELLERYLIYGGMPKIASLQTNQAKHSLYMDSLYQSVIVRDILSRSRKGGKRHIQDADMLKRLATFLADGVGALTSAQNVSRALSSKQKSISDKTVTSYLQALCDAYIFYPVRRYDIKGKNLLKTLPKYYIVDVGIRSNIMGYRMRDFGRTFENIVFLQLLYDGFEVHVGKLYQKEVDFVAIKDGRQVYVQVTDSMLDDATRKRELAPLQSIQDAYEKCVIVRQGSYPFDEEGIKILHARDFLLKDGL